MIEKTKRLNVPQHKESIISRVMIIGDPQSGKSTFVTKFLNNTFSPTYSPTLGVDYSDKHLQINGNLFYFNILDFSGREEYLEIRNEFYRDATVLLVFVDLTSKKSVDLSMMWINEAKDNQVGCPIVVVGAKADIKKVSVEAERFAGNKMVVSVLEISCKEGNSITTLINTIANLSK